MKNILISTFLLFDFISVYSQNIVVNPSFEIYSVCPSAGSPISDVTGWNSFKESPDYLNSCAATASCVSVPATCAGYQQAASGNAYVAIFCYGTNGFDTTLREYIGAQLLNNLSIGQKYYVSFKINLPKRTYCAINNVGILFSTIPYSFSNPAPINNFAHVYSASIITDTLNWVTVSGSLIADSVYQYIIIGNFFDNPHTLYDKLDSSFPFCGSYYFVDDICVSTDSMTCNGITGINEIDNKNLSIKIYPNPAQQSFNIELPQQQHFNLLVYDVTGRKVYQRTNAIGTTNIDASGFSSSIYFIKAVSQRTILTGKLIKE